jgi:hypothetical protein
LADDAFARPELIGEVLALFVSVGAQQLQYRRAAHRIHEVEDPVLHTDHRRQLGQDQLSHRHQVLLALQHARELRQVCLQPILLGVFFRGVAQITNHLIDVVLERCDLAERLHLNTACEVALGHRSGDFGDRAHLRGQIGGELVDVVGQVAPGSGGAWHVGLSAELSFATDLACHRGDLGGKRGQGVNHFIDRVRQRGDLAFRFH